MTTPKEIEEFIARNKPLQADYDNALARQRAAEEIFQLPSIQRKTQGPVGYLQQNLDPLFSQAITVTENPDGTVTVRTGAGKNRSIPKEYLEDYNSRKNNKLLKFEDDRNRADAIRRWGVDNPQIVENSRISLTTNNEALLNSTLNKEFDLVTTDDAKKLYGDTVTSRSSAIATQTEIVPAAAPGGPTTITNPAQANQAASKPNPAAQTATPPAETSEVQQLDPKDAKKIGENTNAAKTDAAISAESAAPTYEDTKGNIVTAIQAQKVSSSSSAARVDETTNVNNQDSNYSPFGNNNRALPPVLVTTAQSFNQLDNSTSYTYSLALHILSKSEYNAMVENAGKNFTPQHTLIASAGRDGGTTGTKRAPGWADNFFFDKLSMTSVIGMNRDSRGTNVINIEFTVIEPMGLSLIDRLIRTTRNLYRQGQTGDANTTGEITYFHNCYLLQIDFFDSEQGCLQNMRKFLPIKLTDLRIKVTSRGSEYAFSAQPFGHQALLQSMASTPANFECVAGTLQEFFRSEDDESARAATEANQREQGPAFVQSTNQAFLTATGAGARVEAREAATVQNVKSYVAAYNAWFKELKKSNTTDKTKDATKIRVVFDEKFFEGNNGKLRREGIGSSVGDKPMVDGDTTQPANGGNIPSDKTKDRFVITAGTQVTQVINMAMANTEYIRSQIIIPEKGSGAAFGAQTQTQRQGTLKWWKVVPAIKLQDFDPVSNKWAFDITYYVLPFEVFNTSHPHAPKAAPTKNLCVREYEYLYTGMNTAVIDFQVDFDYLYFVKVLAFRDKATDSSTRAETVKNEEKSGTDSNDRQSSNNIASTVLQFITDETSAAGQRLRGDEIGMAVASVAESVYSSARGEMLNVNMKIIGDPAFIKQDDMFTGVARALATADKTGNGGFGGQDTIIDAEKSLENTNNSLLMDEGDLLVWVNLRLPVDMDSQTGGVRKEKVGDISSFTGVYKVLMVENEFGRGQFTQTLQMIRYMDQPADEDYRKFNSERLSGEAETNRGVPAVDNQNNPPPDNSSAAQLPNFNSANEDEKRNVISAFTEETIRDGIVVPVNRFQLRNDDFITDINEPRIDPAQRDLINTFNGEA